VNEDFDFDLTSYEIEDWSLAPELPDNAKAYIARCEALGSVYSLNGLQRALNLEEITLNNTYIFITNKY